MAGLGKALIGQVVLREVDLDQAADYYSDGLECGYYEPDYSFKEYLMDNYPRYEGVYYYVDEVLSVEEAE